MRVWFGKKKGGKIFSELSQNDTPKKISRNFISIKTYRKIFIGAEPE